VRWVSHELSDALDTLVSKDLAEAVSSDIDTDSKSLSLELAVLAGAV
jgi:hypothetical protein